MTQLGPALDPRLLQTLSFSQSIAARLVDSAARLAVNLIAASLIVVVAVWASGSLSSLVRRTLGRIKGSHAPDPTLIGFIASLARYLILVVGLVAVLQQLGMQATSVVAVLGAASLAVGLAMQGALSNVAAGVMILLFRPYRVGDVIETATKTGRVRALDLFVTELTTLDNLKVVIPNSKVFGDVIVNHSQHERRRVDATFRIPLAADLQAVTRSLISRAKADLVSMTSRPPGGDHQHGGGLGGGRSPGLGRAGGLCLGEVRPAVGRSFIGRRCRGRPAAVAGLA